MRGVMDLRACGTFNATSNSSPDWSLHQLKWNIYMKQTREWLRANLTGFSIPAFGISWQPTIPESKILQKLIDYLNSKRALGVDELGKPSHSSPVKPEWLSLSVLQIRNEVNLAVQSQTLSPPVRSFLQEMETSCNEFLSILENEHESKNYEFSLRIWQRMMASSIYRICRSYEGRPGPALARLIEVRLKDEIRLGDLKLFYKP